jgi:hypothetical protein
MDAVLADRQVGSVTERIAAAGGVFAMGAGAAAVWYFDPSQTNFFPVCPLYKLTGFACPGCGMTRGFHALAHGDIATALHFNALIPLFALLFLFFGISLVLYAFRGRGLRVEILRPQILWGLFSLLIVFGLARNLPLYPFTVLFP